jgi:hypothetical protein
MKSGIDIEGVAEGAHGEQAEVEGHPVELAVVRV